jgi:hypothetical protein
MVRGQVTAAGKSTVSMAIEFPAYVERKGHVWCGGNQIEIVDGPGTGQVRFVSDCQMTGDAAKTGPDSVPLTAACTVRPAWDVVPEAGKSVIQVLGYRKEDIGHPAWGIQHANHPNWDDPSWNMPPYTQINKCAWPAQVLAARILGLKKAWNNDPVFMLIDEYIANTSPDGSYLGEHHMDTHGWHYPQFWSVGTKTPTGQYSISGDFVSAMWNTYRSKYEDPPKGHAE